MPLLWRFFWLCTATVLLQACATPKRIDLSGNEPQWSGRMSLVINGSPAQQMSASFALSGQATQGQLDFFSPLGSTSASLRWSPDQALWLHDGKTQTFSSLAELTDKATGTNLPVAALFDWLQGRNTQAPGWQADLTQIEQGKISARRTQPLPEVSLRLILD